MSYLTTTFPPFEIGIGVGKGLGELGSVAGGAASVSTPSSICRALQGGGGTGGAVDDHSSVQMEGCQHLTHLHTCITYTHKHIHTSIYTQAYTHKHIHTSTKHKYGQQRDNTKRVRIKRDTYQMNTFQKVHLK